MSVSSADSASHPLVNAPLRGATVLVTGARKGKGFADMIARLGGVPILAPTVGAGPVDSSRQVASAVARIGRDEVAWATSLTGVGTHALFEAAQSLGERAALLKALAQRRPAANAVGSLAPSHPTLNHGPLPAGQEGCYQ